MNSPSWLKLVGGWKPEKYAQVKLDHETPRFPGENSKHIWAATTQEGFSKKTYTALFIYLFHNLVSKCDWFFLMKKMASKSSQQNVFWKMIIIINI